MSEDERTHIEKLLKINRRNRDILEQQIDSAGGEANAPINKLNERDAAIERIKELEARLAALGGTPAPEQAPAQSGRGNTAVGGINVVGSPGASANVSGTVMGRDQVNNTGGQSTPTQTTAPAQPADDTQRVFMDFDIASGSPVVTLRSTIIGTRRIPFKPPYNDAALPVVIRALDAAQGNQQPFSDEELTLLESLKLVVNGSLSPDVHRIVGGALYAALTSEGRGSLEAVRNYSVDQNKPVSYVLRFPRESVNLAALPWEAMWDGDQAVLLARGNDVDSVERYMDIERALPPPVPPGRRLRLLALSPQSRITDEVRGAERAARLASWNKLRDEGIISYDEISPLTVRALSDYIRNADAPPDIIHFYGHGHYKNGEGFLEFDNGAGGAALISAQRLAALFGNVRLVMLQACQTAMVTQAGGLLTGVAPALSIVTGAVVAMQLSVRVEAATRFSEVFYDELLRRRRSLQSAVAEGRQTLYFEEADGASWYVPTLYIRAREQRSVYLIQ